MKIETTLSDKVCTLVIHGRIDTLTSPELEKSVKVNAEKCNKMIFDMTDVDYISSAGIRVIVLAHKTMGEERLVLKSVSGNVMEILNMTGFTNVLKFE